MGLNRDLKSLTVILNLQHYSELCKGKHLSLDKLDSLQLSSLFLADFYPGVGSSSLCLCLCHDELGRGGDRHRALATARSLSLSFYHSLSLSASSLNLLPSLTPLWTTAATIAKGNAKKRSSKVTNSKNRYQWGYNQYVGPVVGHWKVAGFTEHRVTNVCASPTDCTLGLFAKCEAN